MVRPQIRFQEGLHLHAGGGRLAIVTLADCIGEAWLAFIDNAAGQCALNKGYGRDASVNGILAAFWSMAARHRCGPPSSESSPSLRGEHLRPHFPGRLHLAVGHGWRQGDARLEAIWEVRAWATDDLE